MFVGHYSASFAGTAMERRIPLWLLFIAVQFVDIMWAILVLLGVEKARIVPGITASNALDLYYMPYTHSLLGALGWSVLALVACQFVPRLRGMKPGLILALAIFSHWVLDLVVHRPDLGLYGDNLKMGLGLWNYRIPAFLLEMTVLVGGWLLYRRRAGGSAKVAVLVGVLAVIQIFGTFIFPPPVSANAEAFTALFFYFILAGAAWWAERSADNRFQPAA